MKQNNKQIEYDILKEVGNIGAGHAATALSKLLNKKVNMEIPSVKMVAFDDIADSVGGMEQIVVAVFLRVTGDAPGNMFFILTEDSARMLLRDIISVDESSNDTESYSEIEISALHEIGNILAGSYLSSLADLTNLKLSPTVPSLAIDMAGAVLSFGLIQYGEMGDNALIIDTKFFEGTNVVNGHFFLIPDPESYVKILTALGVADL